MSRGILESWIISMLSTGIQCRLPEQWRIGTCTNYGLGRSCERALRLVCGRKSGNSMMESFVFATTFLIYPIRAPVRNLRANGGSNPRHLVSTARAVHMIHYERKLEETFSTRLCDFSTPNIATTTISTKWSINHQNFPPFPSGPLSAASTS